MKEIKNKNKLTVRIACVILVIVLCAPLLLACDYQDDGDVSNTTAATTAPDAGNEGPNEGDEGNGDPTGDIDLISNGSAGVRVIYTNKDGEAIIDAAKDIGAKLGELGGAKISAVVDFAIDKNDSVLEILVGGTKYDVSTNAMEALAPNSYSITVVGNKVIVVASNPYLYSEAVDALLDAVTVSGKNVTLSREFSETSKSYSVLSLIEDKVTEYSIVYANSDKTAKEQAAILQGMFSDEGIDIEVYPDTNAVTGKEILIGNTNRPASANSKAYYLNAYSYVDNKGNLSITGNLSVGVADLGKYLYKCEDSVYIPEMLFGSATPEGFGNTPKYEGSGTVKLIENHELSNSYYVQASGATQNDYNNYVKKLEAAGYSKYHSAKANKSQFATYTDGYNIVNLSYIEYVDGSAKYINIAIDCTDNSALPVMEDDSESVTTFQLTMVNTECSFILRLEDGRFIIFDGGTNGIHDRDNAKLLYDLLVSQNVLEGKPIIAAWYISHHHGDHVGGFINFLSKYGSKISLETVIMNTPSQATMSSITDGTDYEYGWITNVFNRTKLFVPNVKFIIAHAGQRFVYAGLTVDVLYTPENYYGSTMFYGNH
ncbi:MAG: hypothetical protein J6Q77_00875, partial [Clostridia bacterium]|nr:hypothetical protein [Clostridia bacterium]